MLGNYVRAALRSLQDSKLTAGINILGLSVGVAASFILIIGLHGVATIDEHLTADKCLYRVLAQEIVSSGETHLTAFQREDLAERLTSSFAEVEAATRVIRTGILMRVGDQHVEQSVVEVDTTFLRMFGYGLAAGDPAVALRREDQVVISMPLAQRVFGALEGPHAYLGRDLHLYDSQGERVFVVSGVLDPLPRERSLSFEAIIRFENYPDFGYSSRWDSPTSTYVTLRAGVDPAAMTAKLDDFSRDFVATVKEKYVGNRWQDRPDAFRLLLQPSAQIHKNTDVQSSYETATGSEPIVVLTILIGIILAVTCLNFAMLSFARSMGRTREVGIRKALGAQRRQVVVQFLVEGLLVASISTLCGFALVQAGLPTFNAVFEVEDPVRLFDLGYANVVLLVVALTVALGVLAGIYPASKVARQHVATAVRGQSRINASKSGGVAVVLQYGLATFLLSCTIVILQQVSFLETCDLGYDAEQVFVLSAPVSDSRLAERFQASARQLPGVADVTMADRTFSLSTSSTTIRGPNNSKLTVFQYGVDPAFISTLGIELHSGRTFSAERGLDRTNSVIVNASLVRALGLQGQAVGQLVHDYGNHGVVDSPRIIGVVPDFHYRSLREPIQPALFHYGPETEYRRILLRLEGVDTEATTANLRELWDEMAPEQPFDGEFLDVAFGHQYQDEQRIRRLISLAAAVAVLTACMGLVGHTAAVLQSRRKQIGVRKALGASTKGILLLLSRDLSKMVGLACLLSFPLAHLVMSEWMSQYAYQFGYGPSTYLLSVAVAMLIALATVGYRGIQAAMQNPVEVLRP